MNSLTQQLHALAFSIQINAPYLGMLIGSMWLIHIINAISGYKLNNLGIYPRQRTGLIGIIAAPFLHGDFNHLLFNSIPLFILANFVLLDGSSTFIILSIILILGEGIAVWLVGRKAIHIGASGLIMGYWGYLVIGALQNPSLTTIFLLIVCCYYFGGFISSLLPSKGASWEGHVLGLTVGMASYYFQLVPYIDQFIP